MGTQKDENPARDTEVLVQQSLKYKEVIQEYCTLASLSTLTESEADRIEEILLKAQSEPWLDFLIDEADHILAHKLGLMDKQAIKSQQNKLSQLIDRNCLEQQLMEIQNRSQKIQNRSKEIQEYLKVKGVYHGAIDGKMGSLTRTAIESLKKEGSLDSEIAEFFDSGRWSAC
ncbi:peptidoglycan-binding domain-containing protein [Lyngbya aestuarii]|uniref:peptidoglycan-binding domain-containing protein n=1 Tax=Lyngbya aestuarii TaxID=118322 RepID=UPI00403DF39F